MYCKERHMVKSDKNPDVLISFCTPCNHLLLLIGGMASTTQDFCRSGEEVQAVVLEVLIYQRQENLRIKKAR